MTATSTFAAAAPASVCTSVSRFLIKKLRLKVNEAKSAIARPEERKFLGFSISNDGSERRIAPKALDKFKTQIRGEQNFHGSSAPVTVGRPAAWMKYLIAPRIA